MEMNKIKTDIDIDVIDRESLLTHFDHIPAIIKKKDNTYDKHNSGVYLQPIPFDQLTGLSSIDYKEAEDRGYFKLDFLNNSLYEGVRDEEHLDHLLSQEPIWDLFQHEDVIKNLAHVHAHINVLKVLKPKSIVELAEVLAIIRPAKRHLLHESKEKIKNEVWKKPSDGSYYFKKAHAIAYAVSIVVQLNLFCEQVEQNAV
jgi:hypothetical protein|tara:strand:- start:371 stop:970 length:600 start_codon:yes stop_codon:yes gene_type:complete